MLTLKIIELIYMPELQYTFGRKIDGILRNTLFIVALTRQIMEGRIG